MPMTSQCDGDAMQWCHADNLNDPLVEQGYIAQCLTEHAANLTRACWAIVSLGDHSQVRPVLNVPQMMRFRMCTKSTKT